METNHERRHYGVTPIGVVSSPFKELKGMPIQPKGGAGIRGTIQIYPEYREGLKDIEGFSHIILLTWLHKSKGYSLIVKPFLDDTPRGVFATRAPKRPNPIGISTVRLLSVEESTLHIEDVDILDGTPLLDLKPYVPKFDDREAKRIGWLAGRSAKSKQQRSDDRFK